MSEFDPVSWETIEATIGSPAAGVTEYVEGLSDEVSDETPAIAVKAIYDTWKDELGEDRTTPDQGAAFIIAYLLEREGAITLGEGEEAITSITDRRPSSERLHELFWERKQTLWWIATRVGVHWALVQYWLYEEEIPLQEGNLTNESMARVRAYREQKPDE